MLEEREEDLGRQLEEEMTDDLSRGKYSVILKQILPMTHISMAKAKIPPILTILFC